MKQTFVVIKDLIPTLYIFEMVLKLIGYGVYAYWESGWNRFDALLVIFSFLSYMPKSAFGR